MGHYIDLAYDENLLDSITIMINIPFRHAFAPQRWKNATHIILPKTDPPIRSRLRHIQLIESDVNCYYKIKVNKHVMQNAEKFNLIPDEMHGGRRKQNMQNDHLIQTLTYDHMRVHHQDGYTTQMDNEN